MTIFYQEYRKRIRFVSFTFLVLTILLGYRLFHIHVIKYSDYLLEVNRIIESRSRLQGYRGLIMDRNKKILAGNIEKYSFAVDTNKDIEKDKITSLFSEIFSKPENYYVSMLAENSNNIVIEENKPTYLCKKILETPIKGLYKKRNNARVYPYNELASQIIGYTNEFNEGITGVEHFYETILKAEEKQNIYHRQSGGNRQTSLYNKQPVLMPGSDIILSLDMKIQCILQDELLKALDDTKAKSVNGIIIDPFTGEILAAASVPALDLNDYANFSIKTQRNKVFSDAHAPGSTFKIIALAAGIEEGLFGYDNTYFCENGSYRFHGLNLRDTESHQELTVREIIIKSSNIGIAKMVQEFSPEIIYKYARKFGFGEKTGIMINGEAEGKLHPLNNWSGVSNIYVAIGQELTATTLQTALAYSVIANGGYLLKPILTESILNQGEIVFQNKPEVVRKVISRDTADKIISLLVDVVKEGSGHKAYIPGYLVAGKTGTSETFLDGKKSSTDFIPSFAGIFPANNPKYVCVVSLNTPMYGKHWGSESAAPAVKNIFQRIISDSDNFHPEPSPEKEIKLNI